MCLYRGMSQGRVSQPCIGAVSDLYELRAQYWQESQQDPNFHHGHFGLLIVAGLLLVCCVRRFYAMRYEKKVRSLLTALHTHPHLKASVEAETGVAVPAPVPARTCCVGADSSEGCSKSMLVRFAKVIAFAVVIFVVSFVVSFTSLEITMNVVNNMDEHADMDPETGEPAFTSPLVAMFVLLLVCTAELTLLALAVKGLKVCFCPKDQGDVSADLASGGSPAPSAPQESSFPPGSRGRRNHLSRTAQQVWASLPTAHLNMFRSSRSADRGSGYAALPGEENDRAEALLGGHSSSSHGIGTEMVSVNMSAYPAQYTPHTHTTASVAAPMAVQYAQYTPQGPITARPVNAINMV